MQMSCTNTLRLPTVHISPHAFAGMIENQNLHGLSNANMIIVTNPLIS